MEIRKKPDGTEIPTKSDGPKSRRKGSDRHCCYEKCKSDTRRLDTHSDVRFIPFWKPGRFKDGMSAEQLEIERRQTEKCERWVRACSRRDGFSVDKITRSTYICSLHFVGGGGPTPQHPDPIQMFNSTDHPDPIEMFNSTEHNRNVDRKHCSAPKNFDDVKEEKTKWDKGFMESITRYLNRNEIATLGRFCWMFEELWNGNKKMKYNTLF